MREHIVCVDDEEGILTALRQQLSARFGSECDIAVAKNAREEKMQARAKEHEKQLEDPQYHEEMAKLYRQHVLKEQPTLQIQGLGGKKKSSEPAPVLHKPVV